MPRKSGSTSFATVTLATLVASLGKVPDMKVTVSKNWARATQTALSVDLGVSDAPAASVPATAPAPTVNVAVD